MADPLSEFISMFPEALVTTLIIGAGGIGLGFLLGIFIGTGRAFGNAFISKVCTVYVELIRGVPLIVQLLIWNYGFAGLYRFLEDYLGFPSNLSGDLAAILAIGFNSGAYQAEIVRAGVNAIPTGQTEAGLSLGMNKKQVINTVLLPQAMRISIPPLINEFVIVMKDTSQVLAIGVWELAAVTQSLVSKYSGSVFEVLIMSSLVYLLICTSISLLSKLLERKLAIAGYGVKGRKNLL